jgi:hypothetical protein
MAATIFYDQDADLAALAVGRSSSLIEADCLTDQMQKRTRSSRSRAIEG